MICGSLDLRFGSYTYDSNGNTLTKTASGSTTNYTWDYENRLASVVLPGSGGTVTFKYDPLGRRIQKAFTQNSTTTTTNYVYDGSNSVADIDQNANVLARYAETQNVDEPIAESRSGTTTYYEADGLGSVTSLTNGAGGSAQTYTFDSFGTLTASSGSITNPFRNTGREFDSETGLYYFRARYYDPAIGRFASEDPIGFWGGIDFYAFVRNSSANYTDPTGTIIKICSRGGWQNIFPNGGFANHAYFLDPRNGRNCGRGNQSGKEDPSSPGTVCVDVPGSDGREDDVMSCCEKTRQNGAFFPGVNDCHTSLERCLKDTKLPLITAPGGRWGARCSGPECQPGPWLTPWQPWNHGFGPWL
jgi:RHS repeat-associated protein